ncbi:MAG TPA: DUF1559 domain-containing protein [Capsulimonadaceae bacterium]|jgi:prepilin-type N-terminal cleavage/methylation domain-containing protein/prepilin-type processing-associated H-X9-DG protein
MKKAFTLIELLIVISIIAILAAILFPVFMSAREKARQSTCASNEKQLGIAFLQYIQDYDDMFPTNIGASITPSGTGWAGTIYPYVKSTSAFMCPDDNSKYPDAAYNAYGSQVVSYSFNSNVGAPPGPYSIGGATAKMSQTSKTVMLAEVGPNPVQAGSNVNGGIGGRCTITAGAESGSWKSMAGNGRDLTDGNRRPGLAAYDTGYMGGIAGAGSPTNAGVNMTTGADGRHQSGANFLLCDGHVKFLSGSKVSVGYVCFGNVVNPTLRTTQQDSQKCNNTSSAFEAAGTDGNLPDGTPASVTFSPI